MSRQLGAQVASVGRSTWQARLAWSLAVVAAVLAGLHTWLFLGWSAARAETVGWPILTVGTVLGTALGALIVTRRPGHPIGWLFLVGSLCAAIGDPLFAYSAIVTSGPYPDPPVIWQWLSWVARILDTPEPLLLVALLFLLFPDGRLPSPRWRPLLWVGVSAAALFSVVITVAAPPWQITVANDDGPYGPVAKVFVAILLCTLLLVLLGAAASVVVRLRRSSGLERQQLRWLASAASLVAVGFAWALMAPWHEGIGNWLRVLPLHVGFVCVIVAGGLAVLRYRLYDLDIVVSRAILVTTATAFVAAGYVLLVVVIGRALPTSIRGGFWPSLLATAVVAVAFQPLRAWAVRLADQIAYGSRAAPYEALATFARRLESAQSPTGLLAQVAAAVGEAVGARQVTAVLEAERDEHQAAVSTWPTRRADAPSGDERLERQPPIALTIQAHGEQLGRVEILLPPGVLLRPDDAAVAERLLAASAVALRNLRLENELAAQVVELDRHTTELAASRTRIAEAGDQEKARFSLALSRQVLPHLQPLPDRLVVLARRCSAGDGLAVDAEHQAATDALDELRRLVHGMGPDVRQRAAVSQAAVNRSGPNADLVT